MGAAASLVAVWSKRLPARTCAKALDAVRSSAISATPLLAHMDDDSSTPATSTAISLPAELCAAVGQVLREGESLEDFALQAIRSAIEARRRSDCAFYARGDAAWAEYQRTGVSIPAADVFAEVHARIELRRQQLQS